MILLVKPEPAHTGFSLDMALQTEPLELEYIKAMLTSHSISSYIYDASTDSRSFESILELYRPQAVAITGYITQEYLMLSYARRARAFSPKTITIIGGSHAQHNQEHFFKPEVSYICRSDNIYAILDVLNYEHLGNASATNSSFAASETTALPLPNADAPNSSISSGGTAVSSSQNAGSAVPSLDSIDGLCYLKDGAWFTNPVRPFDINLLPIPERSQFTEHMHAYRYLDVSPIALIKTSTSCPYQCSFCYGRTLNCGTYYQRDVASIIEELLTIPCDNIQIADDDFLFDIPRLLEFMRLIREHHIHKTFICYGRADFISTHEDLMKELASIGLKYCMVGLEAVDDTRLASYNKHTSSNANLETIRILKEAGIRLTGLFIIDINFTRNDFRAMRRFIHRHNITYTGVSIFTPIPGTALYEEYKDRLITHNMEKWDFMHLVVQPVHMTRFHFYLEYYLFVMDLFQIAQKAGIYRFLRLKDYKNIFLKLLFSDSFRPH